MRFLKRVPGWSVSPPAFSTKWVSNLLRTKNRTQGLPWRSAGVAPWVSAIQWSIIAGSVVTSRLDGGMQSSIEVSSCSAT